MVLLHNHQSFCCRYCCFLMFYFHFLILVFAATPPNPSPECCNSKVNKEEQLSNTINCNSSNNATCPCNCTCTSISSMWKGEHMNFLSTASAQQDFLCAITLTHLLVNLLITSPPGLLEVWEVLNKPGIYAAFFTGVFFATLVCWCDRRCCRCASKRTVQ